MTDVPPNTGDESGVGHDRGAVAGTPRWVKLFGIIALVLILLFVIIQLSGRGGDHGPGNHAPSSGAADYTLASNGYELTGRAGRSSDAARTLRGTTLDTMTFEPSGSTMPEGETVTLGVTKTGRAVPEFALGDAAHGPNNVTLQPGRTR